MLNTVPTAINRASRQVVLRHPNAMPIMLYRKQVTRQELDENGDPSLMGGMPTLGGMGVLRSEDEAEFEYVDKGEGKILFAAPFAGSDVVRRGDALVPEAQREVLIECAKNPADAQYWEAQSGDLLMVNMGMGMLLAYEVVDMLGTVNVPPYTRRYTVNPRDDLSYLTPFDDEQDPENPPAPQPAP